MMPDLGKYATEVLLAYGVSIVLIAGLVGVCWRQSVAARRALDAFESRKNTGARLPRGRAEFS